MKRYGKYIRPYWYAFILGPLLMLTEVAGEVLLPSFMADIINVGAANHDVGYILQKGMIMILTAFIMMAGGVGGAWFASVAAINFGTGCVQKNPDLLVFGNRPVLHGLSGYASDQRYHTGAEPDHDGASNDASRPRHADWRDYYGVFDESGAGGSLSGDSAGYDSGDHPAFAHCLSQV